MSNCGRRDFLVYIVPYGTPLKNNVVYLNSINLFAFSVQSPKEV